MAVSGVDTGLVVGQFVIGLVDGFDPNDEPDMVGARGSFEFAPAINYVPVPHGDPNPFTLLRDPFIAVLDDEGYICTPDPDFPTKPGKRGLRLFATDSPDASVINWTWKVTPKFVNSMGMPIASFIAPFNIAVPTDGVVDLATAVKVPSSQGLGTEQIVVIASKAEDAARYSARQAEYAAEEASSAGISAWEATEVAAQAMAVSELAQKAVAEVKKKSDDGDFVPKISVGTVTSTPNPADEVWMSDIIKESTLVSDTLRGVFPTSMRGEKGDAGGWGTGTILSTSTNLDTVRTPGLYTNATAVTLTQNYPVAGVAGTLKVYTVAGQSYLINQEWTPNPHTKAVNAWSRGYYTRAFNTQTWSDWRFMAPQRIDTTAGRVIYTWDDTANREQLVHGDTGKRIINDLVNPELGVAVAKLRRIGYEVELHIQLNKPSGLTGKVTVLADGLPAGFRNQHTIVNMVGGTSGKQYTIDYGGSSMSIGDVATAATAIFILVKFSTNDPWPTTLPGTADGPVPNL